MHIVGRHQGRLSLLTQLPVKRTDLFLLRQPVILDLQIKIPLRKDFPVFPEDFPRVFLPTLQIGSRDFSLDAGTGSDQPGRMLGQKLLINSGFVINTLQMRCRHEMNQVLVPLQIPRQQEKMIVRVLAPGP